MKTLSDYLSSNFFESFSINEVGIKLNPSHLSKIRTRLQELEARAPAYSSINLNFTNIGPYIQGQLTINAAGKQFNSTIQGEDPWKIYKQLEASVDHQINQWKKNRFTNQFAERFNDRQHQCLTGGYAV
ncbi:MAG: hypothetical protein H6621_10900 [Halobacteriovoraceae bacterium]|nr:hypothetical protein [Halobacteriovoraceae bacterium]MCB9095566.1 hypothetical protein [Halobacteriovoraceae bacterium]